MAEDLRNQYNSLRRKSAYLEEEKNRVEHDLSVMIARRWREIYPRLVELKLVDEGPKLAGFNIDSTHEMGLEDGSAEVRVHIYIQVYGARNGSWEWTHRAYTIPAMLFWYGQESL